ncbi:glycogen debranching enzyme GlgX [candidate division KSB1 bacterium]|nr:glycogen debranching protein GlgX [candidate division KSB1 bacterium]RQW05227.1 MAG: glycogen debranching enzyme GlgX [candidate division KSB1 bacterium]
MKIVTSNPDQQYGRSYPLGATVYPEGVNFSIYTKNARAVEILLFEDADDTKPYRVIRLDPQKNRTFFYWHTFVNDIGAGQLYGYRVYGPYAPNRGFRFDGHKLLLDPYAKAIVRGVNYDREAAIRPGDNCGRALKCVTVDPYNYDWGDDHPPKYSYANSIIYELHVGGFTKHPSSGLSQNKRGTYAGLIEKLPYLKELGITAVELMPVQAFDEQDVLPPLKNYWGYNPVAFFAPHVGYSSDKSPLGPVNEFRDMVKACHNVDIEVILDVVFNHTAEGNHAGPTLSFRGLENEAYYILENNKAHYANYSGTGNSLNANHSVVRRMILDCLRHWVDDMHVDGFRFDLASVLSRDEAGHPLDNPPTLLAIDTIPEIAHAKIIAEAWDAAGLYQVGSFVGERWAEWNGHYRDDVRRFVKGEEGMVPKIASRILASPDIYPDPNREPNRSINFITCHDGFTLNDLVTFNHKHNEENLENNLDGMNENFSWNCGVEGPTDDVEIETVRLRQIKNLMTILFVSQGTPMLLMGDEIRRSQKGNNNAYCQDNELSWFNWDDIDQHKNVLRFVKGLIDFIQHREIFTHEQLLRTIECVDKPHLIWHGTRLGQPDWGDKSHTLAFMLHHPRYDEKLHVMLNVFWEPLVFELPPLMYHEQWYRIVDTSLQPPDDFMNVQDAPFYAGDTYQVNARSVVVLAVKTKK